MTDTVEVEWPAVPEIGNIPADLAKAVVAAWAELGNLTKGKTADAGTYRYQYSDLGDLLEMCRPVLAKHGLALLQPVTREAAETTITLETWLLHTSGYFLRWRFAVPATGSPQQIGSSITYGRRYSGQAALGVASEDDDGQAAAKAPPPSTPPVESRRGPGPTPKQTKHAMALFGDLGLQERGVRLEVTSKILGREVGSWADVLPREATKVIDALIQMQQEDDVSDDSDAEALRRDILDAEDALDAVWLAQAGAPPDDGDPHVEAQILPWTEETR